MTTTYRAMQIAAGGRLELVERPVPAPGPDEVLIRVEACGICGADAADIENADPALQPPRVPGHEVVGRIAALGAGVPPIWKLGQRVGVGRLGGHCNQCAPCRQGRFQLCRNQPVVGASCDGGYAEMMLARNTGLVAIPDELDACHAAPILCAGVTVYKGLKATEARPGEWVVVSGIGGLGHMAVQYARAMGLNVAAVDIDDSKLDLATRLGATLTVNARNEDPSAALKKAIGGAHGALVTAVSPKAFQQALGMVRRGGTVALNGLPPGDFPLSIFDTVLNGITVRGSIVGTRLDLLEALAFAGEGKVKATVHADKLENINDVFSRMHHGDIEGRIVLDLA